MKLLLDDEPLGEVSRLRLQPGDAIVIRLDHPVSYEEFEAISEGFRSFLGEGVPVLITEGVDITVVSPQ